MAHIHCGQDVKRKMQDCQAMVGEMLFGHIQMAMKYSLTVAQ